MGLFGKIILLSIVVYIAYILVWAFQNPKRAKGVYTFILHCFLKPTGKNADKSQQTALESFYQGQSEFYDMTRSKLLQGRTTLLALVAAELRSRKAAGEKSIWLDIGGGTGWNIEEMDKITSIEDTFEAIYLIDLSPSLCKVAESRIERLGLGHIVHVVCADATKFEIKDIQGRVDLATMSYSLSMIPSYFAAVDKAESLLSDVGIIGVVDFYVMADYDRTSHDGKHVSWLPRQFWKMWFEIDRVFLESSRREYLEYRFDTLKTLNGRNKFIIPFLVKIPYYIWIGLPKSNDNAVRVKGNATTAISKQTHSEGLIPISTNKRKTPLVFTQKYPWRQPYDLQISYEYGFSDYMYAFTWEDPRVDMEVLSFRPDDVILAITSAGDNALAYACSSTPPKMIHCVDLNPYQNHLLELKLAAIASLSFEDFYDMFGNGSHKKFLKLLVTQISPHLSSYALEFWIQNAHRFDSLMGGLYRSGYSGTALSISQWAFWLAGCGQAIKDMCETTSVVEQERLYITKIRPVLTNPLLSQCVAANPVFLWRSLGVPLNQKNIFQEETTTLDYITDTLDPLPSRSLFSKDNYFYRLCLLNSYSSDSCPDYLIEENFNKLKERSPDSFLLHTRTIQTCVESMDEQTLDKAILMDHADWFDRDGKELTVEVLAIRRAMKDGGLVMFRSAAKMPWYVEVFDKNGFKCRRVSVRESGKSIDRFVL